MQRTPKIARFAVVMALSLVISMCFQGGIIGQRELLDETEKETLKPKITKDHKNIPNVKGINKNTVET